MTQALGGAGGEESVTRPLGSSPASGGWDVRGGGTSWVVFKLGPGKTLITFFFFCCIKGKEYSSDSLPSFDRCMIIGWFYVYKGQR